MCCVMEKKVAVVAENEQQTMKIGRKRLDACAV